MYRLEWGNVFALIRGLFMSFISWVAIIVMTLQLFTQYIMEARICCTTHENIKIMFRMIFTAGCVRKCYKFSPKYLHRSPMRVKHYSDIIMRAMASQITGIWIVYSTVCSGAHQSSMSLAFVRGIHRIPLTKGQLHGKCLLICVLPFQSWHCMAYHVVMDYAM